MSDMADVLADHKLDTVLYLITTPEFRCICGKRSDNHEAHQAAALSAAGFGPVQEAREAAWDEASKAIKSTIGAYAEEGVWAFEQAEKLNPNPYREDT